MYMVSILIGHMVCSHYQTAAEESVQSWLVGAIDYFSTLTIYGRWMIESDVHSPPSVEIWAMQLQE